VGKNLIEALFFIFSSVALVSGSMVVVSKHPVRAVLSLVLTFFATGALWILLEAEFLALTLVLVYVGAVMVLFLFVVMTLDIDLAFLREGFARFLPIGILVALLVIGGLIFAVGKGEFYPHVPFPTPFPADYSNIKTLGSLLYSEYLFPFEIAGVLLLVAIITAISLTFRGRRMSKVQDIGVQTAVTKEDRLTMVKMPSEERVS